MNMCVTNGGMLLIGVGVVFSIAVIIAVIVAVVKNKK